jgi:1-acyl-sn-glycerol-3-phosphate acyltransferase
MLAERVKHHKVISGTERKQAEGEVFYFPIKGGVVKRRISRPTVKLSLKIAEAFFRALFKVLIRYEVRGKENLPRDGAVIAVCNHLHLLDPVLHILSILPRDSIFMAKEELFQYFPIPLFRILMDIAEAFPVRRRGTPEERQQAIDYAVKVLQAGMVFGIYPEGTRSKTGQLKEAYHGCAQIALRTGAPLIPVGIWGTEKLKGLGWLKRPKVVVNFGKPFTLPPVDGEVTERRLKELTEYIMSKLAGVLPPEYRGRYQPC